jgi:hypothetical protein
LLLQGFINQRGLFLQSEAFSNMAQVKFFHHKNPFQLTTMGRVRPNPRRKCILGQIFRLWLATIKAQCQMEK